VQVGRLGEERLIELIQQTVKSRGNLHLGIGDDALVLADGLTVMTTDAYAEGVHFDLGYMSYYDVGTRCASACLSDIVAMGAEPLVMVVALAIPPQTDSREVKWLYQGMEKVCGLLGCEIGGGDIIRFDRLVVTLTALGRTNRPIYRSGAKPGDFLYLTGYAGLAEIGRLVLKKGLSQTGKFKFAVIRHLFPLPRLGVLKRLREHINALIDTSDGLATDARHLSKMSGVRIVIEPERIPVHPATRRFCQEEGIVPEGFALISGEDYELLFTTRQVLPERIDRIPLTRIGRVEAGSGVYLEQENRRTRLKVSGYDHLKPAP